MIAECQTASAVRMPFSFAALVFNFLLQIGQSNGIILIIRLRYKSTMKKLVLIDGNSLLNRAYYATHMLTTKSGMPTNAVFGFTKLLLKLIDDLKPDLLCVAFDLKAPTFRHKMYDGYKATRKPMPDDLAVQMKTLKSLLSSMRIAICEKEGYEADDIIGTLSHRFADTKSIVITGDRDAYQLIDDQTDVYITKTGVSELLRLNKDNFEQQIGYRPDQVIDMKALMGDSSDNIPGVPGIGEKTARALLEKYDTLDELYAHIDEIAGTAGNKLREGKQSAYLSRQLATIDRAVPLSIEESECRICMPFSDEVRSQFEQLEFSSLLKTVLFQQENNPAPVARAFDVVSIVDAEELVRRMDGAAEFAVVKIYDSFYFTRDGKTELQMRLCNGLFMSDTVSYEDGTDAVRRLLSRPDAVAVVYGGKDLRHALDACGIEIRCKMQDVSLMKYLADYTGKDDDLGLVLQQNSLSESAPACGVMQMYGMLSVKLRDAGMWELYSDIELPLADVLYRMERNGVCVDTAAINAFEQKYLAAIDAYTKRIYEAAGERFKINSPAQLGKILFDKLKLPAPKKGRSGSYSTSADVLEKLAPDHEIVRDVLLCRHYQKLQTTYIDGLKRLVDPETHLVHTTFNQIQTSTGRLSSLNPNLQNIPVRDEEGRELRRLFIARAPDRILVDADYSQIELRLLAHFSGCKELIEAFHAGRDIHAQTASQVFGVPLEQVTADQRRAAKTVNFGIIYGMSSFGLAGSLHIAPKKAAEYIEKYFATYSDVKRYLDSNVEFARKHGYVCTLCGRKRAIPEIHSPNFNIRSFGERAAVNMPLQGSSADIIKIAMVNLSRRMHREGLRSQLILQVHDELIIDAYEQECDAVEQILREEMEGAAQLSVPLVAEVHCGKSWYDAK